MLRSLVTAASPTARSEVFFAGQNRALQLLIAGSPLEQVFEALVRTLEADREGAPVVGAILVLDAEGKRLRHGAAPSLPDSYNQAIDGIEIGPDIGTCCAAASRDEVIITVDIANDPGWVKFKALPLGLGLRAAWSMPIRSAGGRVLGTFGTYFRECRGPTPLERELVGVLAKTAAVAIEQRTTEEALRKSENFLQEIVHASPDCIKVIDLAGRLQWMSANGLCAMEVDHFASLCNADWLSFWPDETTRQQVRAALDAARAGEPGRFQGRCPTRRGAMKWWDVVVTPIPNDDGKARALLCVSRDITEQKKVEEALRASEDRNRTLVSELESRVLRRTAQLAEANAHLRREIEERQKTEKARHHLVEQLTTVEEDERRRISRELHDQVGQQITAMMFGLSSLRPHVTGPALEKLRAIEAVAKTVGKEVHDLALKLRPAALDDFGLAQALADHLEEWSKRTGVVVHYTCGLSDGQHFPTELETTIYRLVQEALTNVAKHAQARQVAVIVESCPGYVLVMIEDDGKGFDPESMAQCEAGDRLGLRGMRERAANCGGTMNIESTCGHGATVLARIPFQEPEIAHG